MAAIIFRVATQTLEIKNVTYKLVKNKQDKGGWEAQSIPERTRKNQE